MGLGSVCGTGCTVLHPPSHLVLPRHPPHFMQGAGGERVLVATAAGAGHLSIRYALLPLSSGACGRYVCGREGGALLMVCGWCVDGQLVGRGAELCSRA